MTMLFLLNIHAILSGFGMTMVVAALGYWVYTLLTFENVVPGYVALLLINLLIHYEWISRFCIKQYLLKIMPGGEQITWNVQAQNFTRGE